MKVLEQPLRRKLRCETLRGETLPVTQQPAKFSGYKSCESGDIIFFKLPCRSRVLKVGDSHGK